MRATKLVGIATVLLAGMTASAWAQGRGMTNNKTGAHLAQLKLTPEQKKMVQAFREAALKQVEPLHKEMQAKVAEMKQLWLVDKPSKADIERKQTEVESVGHKLRGIWTDFHLQLHAVLTPEQRVKWAEQMGSGPGMGGGHGKGRGGMRGDGMGDGCFCGGPGFPYGGP